VEGSGELNTETRRHGEAAGAARREKLEGGAAPVSPEPPMILPPGLPGQPVVREMPAYAFRRAIGPRRLKATMFRIEPVSATQYRLTGAGYGHGVGLCQIGARGMASAPYRRTFRQILTHYYRGVKIGPFRPESEPP
jgi:SpoIID/LytB domain protein